MVAPVPPRIVYDQDPGDETPTIFDLSVVVWRYRCLIGAGYPAELAVHCLVPFA